MDGVLNDLCGADVTRDVYAEAAAKGPVPPGKSDGHVICINSETVTRWHTIVDTLVNSGVHRQRGLGQREKGCFCVYEEAPGFRPGPPIMTRAQVRGDRVVLHIVNVPLATFCP